MADKAPRRGDPNDPFGDDGHDDDGEGSNDEDRDQRSRREGDDDGDDNDDAGTDEVAVLRDRLRKQRRLNSELAKKVKQLEPKARDSQTAEERAAALEREREQALSELREERAVRQLTTQAARAGAIDPEDVADLILRRNMVDFDSEGRPVDVAEAVEDLKRNKPHLFGDSRRRTPDGDAGRGNGRRGEPEQKPDWNSAFRKSAGQPRQRVGG